MQPRALQGDDGVLEIRRRRIVHNLAHFLAVLAHAFRESRAVVRVAHPVERRRLVGQRAGVREGVFGHVTSPAILCDPIIPDGHYMGLIL